MRILKTESNYGRASVTVLLNPTDPHWIHEDGTVVPANHTGNTDEGPGMVICMDCRNNWRTKVFSFHANVLNVDLNKWGNPVHDGQEAVSTRDKTWDELYDEIDAQIGQHAVFGNAPRTSTTWAE